MYRCLSLAFRPPQARRVARIILGAPSLLDEILAVAPFGQLCEARALLRQLAVELDDPTALQRRLAREYARLFADPPRGLGPPREAAHTNGRALAPATSVSAVYAAEQFVASGSRTSAPDHITVELAFMAELCQRQYRALIAGAGDEGARLARVQQTFLEDHLRRWGSTLADAVKRATGERFYDALSIILAAWIGLDWALLRAITEAPAREAVPASVRVAAAVR